MRAIRVYIGVPYFGKLSFKPRALVYSFLCWPLWFGVPSIWVVVKVMVPFWGILNLRCRIIIGIQKGTIILTTTHID